MGTNEGFFRFLLYVYVCYASYLYHCTVCMSGTCWDRGAVLDPLTLELQMVILENEPRSSVRRSAFNHRANSSAPQIQTFYLKLWEIIVYVNNIKYQYNFHLTVAFLLNEPLYLFFFIDEFSYDYLPTFQLRCNISLEVILSNGFLGIAINFKKAIFIILHAAVSFFFIIIPPVMLCLNKKTVSLLAFPFSYPGVLRECLFMAENSSAGFIFKVLTWPLVFGQLCNVCTCWRKVTLGFPLFCFAIVRCLES